MWTQLNKFDLTLSASAGRYGLKSIKHRKPVMGLLDRRMGKPVREGSPSTRGGFSVRIQKT